LEATAVIIPEMLEAWSSASSEDVGEEQAAKATESKIRRRLRFIVSGG